ncbi:cobalamin-dependent protein [Sporichthya polymorpha]|uniref:cobalamin-dependent protein n=1 Tax=Sporichthya polymorpha TaxID=35751 RepID=UPI000380E1C2|nr:cobalamin-dependent protein [Sporichthya polymorpha]
MTVTEAALSADVRDRYWDALSRGDRTAAVAAALGELERGVPAIRIFDELVRPAQLEVGRQWATNSWGVAREHVATSISEDVVAALGARTAAGPARGRIVVTCVEGEWHALPARILSESLRLSGWDVSYLGASVPTPHLVSYLHDLGPDLVALSCSVSTSLQRARRMIEAARGAGVPVLAGGRGFGPDGRWALALGANGWAPDPTAALELIESDAWPSFTDQAPPLEHPDDAHVRLRAAHGDLVDATMAELARVFPPMAAYDSEQRARTVEDIGYILDFLTTALFLDDVELFTDFVGWLAEILTARGVPAAAVRLGLDALDAVLVTVTGTATGTATDVAEADWSRTRTLLACGKERVTPLTAQ